ncbi:Dicer-like protein 4 [Vitis vinifera]|uniref:Dicer-like protein 4 n=1 Tax=Vitis vinifera TaxID=29760 RepID=A0A438J815_VITVI|nr:Dicer-like protein 4 [Vitis vinifera]
MHRLENLLVAIELKNMLSASFPEGAEITAHRVLEALTTEKCLERFSLERLEVLGDAFLKFAVGRRLFLLYDALDEGELTRRRSNVSKILNESLDIYVSETAVTEVVYIRDQSFDPGQFFALGHRCPRICEKETEMAIHSRCGKTPTTEVRCSKCHHWLHKKTIADVVEALVGAFIVDSGFKAATVFLKWIGIQVDFEAFQVMSFSIKVYFYRQLYILLITSMEGAAIRLEFLGDAVLDYLITSYLYSVYPKLKPGQMTDLRSLSVNNKSFANVAVSRSLHEFLICDASSLSEAIKKYVDFIRTPTLDKDLHEGPKCPKVSL